MIKIKVNCKVVFTGMYLKYIYQHFGSKRSLLFMFFNKLFGGLVVFECAIGKSG